MIEIIKLLKNKLPEGFTLYPEKDENYKQIRYKDWAKSIHYEIMEKDSLSIEIHLESEKLKHLADIIKPFIEEIKPIDEFKQAEKVSWDPLWRVNHQQNQGAGRLIISFSKNTFPSVIVDAMIKLIDLTFEEININLEKSNSVVTRDKTKYMFNNISYSKNRLVLAVLKKYLEEKKDTTYEELERIFPKSIQANSYGVFKSKEDAIKIRDESTRTEKRYFLEDSEILKTSDKEISVCTQWEKNNIKTFISVAKALGYQIEETIENSEKNNITNEREKNTMQMKLHPLNIILYGPPGTGKTYNSINYALSIIEKKDLKELEKESDTNRQEVEKRFNYYREKGQIEFITFHQNYSYEDFIQGIKPDVENNSQLNFTRKDGIFKVISDRANEGGNFDEIYEKFKDDIDGMPNSVLNLKTKTHSKDFSIKINSKGSVTVLKSNEMTVTKRIIKEYLLTGKKLDWPSYLVPICEYIKEKYNPVISDEHNKNKNFVIIIDEINRANISRVFGELITLIETDKRETLKVTLPSGEIFTVPKNLYIIGTMNTADKSIALLDIALRRRFKFIAKYPDYSKIPEFTQYLKPINEEIVKRKKFPDFMIGHSYFMNRHKNELADIFNNEIIPLLNEYFNNKSEIVEEILKKAKIEYKIDEDSFQIVAQG